MAEPRLADSHCFFHRSKQSLFLVNNQVVRVVILGLALFDGLSPIGVSGSARPLSTEFS